MTPCSWSRPKAAPPPSQRSAAFTACEDRCAGDTPLAIEKNDFDPPPLLVLLARRARGAPPPSQRSAALTACEDRCAGHTPVPIDKNDSDLPPFLVLLPCRRRKLWRLGAQIVASSCADLPTFLLYLRQTHPCHSDCSRHSGARLRQLPRLRCWKQSV